MTQAIAVDELWWAPTGPRQDDLDWEAHLTHGTADDGPKLPICYPRLHLLRPKPAKAGQRRCLECELTAAGRGFQAVDLRALLKTLGWHTLARIIIDPDREVKSLAASSLGGSVAGGWHARRDGIHTLCYGPKVDTDGTALPPRRRRVISWRAVKAHAHDHTAPDVRALAADIDEEWCRVHRTLGGAEDVRATAADLARIRSCERWLFALAADVWWPSVLTRPAPAAAPAPVQLDLLEFLKELA